MERHSYESNEGDLSHTTLSGREQFHSSDQEGVT